MVAPAELADHPAVAPLVPRCTFPAPGAEVTCAVSGGPDSTALAVLAVAHGCRATLVHVDHGLRPGSAAEADAVGALAARLSVPWRSVSVTVPPGPNLEARARTARLGALPAGALTGHTADDQAETVLLNLLRGAAGTGLGAMRPGPTHPLLALRRAETRDLCAALGLRPLEDPTNQDLRWRRNQVRHRVLPLLAEVAQRDPVPVLSRQADLLRDDSDLLDALAARLDPTDARALAGAPRSLARRAVRRWLAEPYPPDAATVERVLAVAAGTARAAEVGRGRRVERRQGRLRLIPAGGPGESATMT